MDRSTVPAGEVEDVTPEVEEQKATPDATDEGQPNPDSEEQDGEGEERPDEEIEFDLGGGQKAKFSAKATVKDIAEHVQRSFKDAEGNLTRKFQEAADIRKSAEATKAAVEKIQGMHGDVLNLYSRGQQIRADIEELSKIDAQALWQSQNPEDRDRARRLSDVRAQKQDEFARIINELNQKEVALSSTQQAETARQAEEGKAVLAKRIPSFEKALPEIIDYAVKATGMSREEAEKGYALNPAVTEAFHKAMLYDRMQTVTKKPAPPPPAQPVTPMKASGNTGRSTLPTDTDDVNTWLKKRQAQLKKARG